MDVTSPELRAPHGAICCETDVFSRSSSCPAAKQTASDSQRSRSGSFDLGQSLTSVAPEHCASCRTEIFTPHNKGKEVFALDLKFCSEGCRCVLLHADMMGECGIAADSLDLDLVGKSHAFQNPCLHRDEICPHFATWAAGLVKNKFHDLSPSPSPHMTHFSPGTLAETLPALDLHTSTTFLKKSTSCDVYSRASHASTGM
mmetsp:Transcript_92883/g.135706  ORF Transcript_92883/g.135706 Transcript_92883/m.135706 type:complete len:201 (+) Transcript_92883:144-746(+)